MAALLLSVFLALPAMPAQAQAFAMKDLGPRALKIVVEHLKSDDSDVRALAAEILGETGNKAAAGMLRGLLEDRDKYVRIASARALWELGSPAGMKTILAIISDVPAQGPIPVTNNPLVELKIISQNKIRERAIEAYTWMKGERGADLLYKLKNDNYGPVRDAAARELARLGRSEELAQINGALTDEEEAIRYEGATLLAKVCHPSAAAPLAKLLAGETSVRVRMAALDALRCNPSRKDAAQALLKLADDENPTIKFKAIVALGGIKDIKVKSKLSAVAAESNDIRVRIAVQKGLVQAGSPADAQTARDAMTAASADIRLEALEVADSLIDDEALPLLAQALDDPDTRVKLSGALKILRRAARK